MEEKITEEEKREFRKVPHKPKRTPPGDMLVVIIAVLVLLFTVILIVSVALINMEVTPSETRPAGVVTDAGGEDTGEPEITIEENRQRPAVPSFTNAPESSTEYRPTVSSAKEIEDSSITSKVAVLVDTDTGEIIYKKGDADEKVEIASLTKLMTLVVACDYLSSPNDFFRVIEIKYSAEKLKGYSTAFLEERFPSAKAYVIDMIYGLVLRSGADCAYGLAEGLAGSEAEFVKRMNAKADALGMTCTNFTNCVGKDDGGNNHSSMRDMATLMTYALKNQLCHDVLAAKRWDCVGKYTWLINNAFTSLVLDNVSNREAKSPVMKDAGVNFLGGKSGNETMSGYCLVSFATGNSGKTYICVTAGHKTSSYEDTVTIYSKYTK